MQLAAEVTGQGQNLGGLTHAQSLEVIRDGEDMWQVVGTRPLVSPMTGILISISVAVLAAIAIITS